MVNETENVNAIEIIRKMIAAGADDAAILRNLHDLGITDETANQMLKASRTKETGSVRTVLSKPEIVIETYQLKSEGMNVEINIIQSTHGFVLEYALNLPEYGSGTRALLNNLKNSIISDASIRTEKMLDPKFIADLKEKFGSRARQILDHELPHAENETKNMLVHVLLQEMLGLGKIEFLLADSNLEEIVINSAAEPIWVYSKKYGWLKTNIFLGSEEDIQNFSSIIARRVGKQITTLNPILDAHLITGDRANATLFPISSRGNTITIRRFRRDPWTVTDFINSKTVNAEIMALVWLAMQYEMNVIVSGGTASGKTSMMNVMLPFIQPNHRILTIEDSVSGESEIVFEQDGKTIKTTVGELIGGLIGNNFINDCSIPNKHGIQILSVRKDGVVEWKKPSRFIRHWVKKDLIEITTQNGCKIKVTPDHSIFTKNSNGKLVAINAKEFKIGTPIAILEPSNTGAFVNQKMNKNQSTVLLQHQKTRILFDFIQKINRKPFEGFVYDFSVPQNESFVANNVVCHNTRELQLPEFLHWVPLTTREPNAEGKGGVCLYPGNWFLLGNGELRQIDEYAKESLQSRPFEYVESNVLSCSGNQDTVVAGDPTCFTYQTEPISIVSKVTERKFICTVHCENGETVSLTENTKLPVIGENGKIELLVPADIQKGKYYLPAFKKIGLELPIQSVDLGEIFNQPKFYAVGVKKILLALLAEAKERGQTKKEITKKMGYKHQVLQWYLKRDIVPVPLLLQLAEQSQILGKSQISGQIVKIKAAGRSSPVVFIPSVIDDELAYLAGFLLAEKCVRPNGVFFSQKEELPYVKKIIKEKFGLDTYHSIFKTQYGKYNNYGILSKPVTHFLQSVFGLPKSKQVRVPKIIMRSPDSVIAAFLAGFIDGDGSVGKGRISLAAPTQEAAIEFKYLLTRLGIWSKIAKGSKVFNVTVARRESLQEAAKSIPFKRPKNKADAETILKTPYNHATKEGLIPALLLRNHLQHLQKISTKEKFRHYYHSLYNQTAMPKKYLQEQLGLAKINEEDLKAAELLLREDLEFVKITGVEIKPNTENIPTYDVTPAKSTYFIAGTHNLTLVMDTMLDLLVNSLRMRPDRIIVGETRRQAEAEVMFEGMHTGHSVYSTFHANTADETIRRFINAPINISPTMLDAVHLNLVMFRNRRLGVRRMLQIAEFIPEKRGGEEVIHANVLYRWRASSDEIVRNSESIRFADELTLHTGMSGQEISEDLQNKQKILEWMVKKNIHDVQDVGHAMAEYYLDESTVLDWVAKDQLPEFLQGKRISKEENQ
ncbi:MAG: ATPase, T2SS/T4P/T4SS family [Candidatus Micrarchaeota archaeon]